MRSERYLFGNFCPEKAKKQALVTIFVIFVLMTLVVVGHAASERNHTNVDRVAVQVADISDVEHKWTEWKYDDDYRARMCTICGKEEIQTDLLAAQKFEKISFWQSMTFFFESFVDMIKLVFNII